MSYIGKTPTSVPLTSSDITDSIISLPKLTDGTDGNLISYDASGNPVAVATGNDGQVLTSTGAGSPPAFETLPVGGITMADQWRITASATDSGADVLDANWERADTDGLGQIGSAMAVSGAVFTFPSTGYYYVTFQAKFAQGSGDQRYCHVYILTTTDNSSYDAAAEGSMWFTSAGDSGTKYGSAATNIIFDVTNTSTHKLKFQRNSEGSVVTEGDSNNNLTFATFIRLGDT